MRRTAPRVGCRGGAGERGMGMVLVIGIGFFVLASAAISIRVVGFALGDSTRHLTYETALHVAEHGIDQTLARIQRHSTHDWSAGASIPADVDTREEEEAWALAQLASAPVQSAPDGQFAAIRPPNRNVIFSMAWVPSKAASKYERILKAEYLFSTYSPSNAILVGGNLTIGGSSAVGGFFGNVHSNGNIDVTGAGGGLSVGGNLTSTGTLTGGANATVGGMKAGGQPAQQVPPLEPLEIYATESVKYAADWFDLCPNGKVRSPGSTPCTGIELADVSGSGSFRSWSFSTPSGKPLWRKGSDGTDSGIYFVHHADTEIRGPSNGALPWRATVLSTGASLAIPCASNPSVTQVSNGDITINANTKMTPFLPGLSVIAGRDLKINGNTSTTFVGFLGAREQIDVNGSASLTGALVAADLCDTATSTYHTNFVSGGMQITLNEALDVAIGTLIRTTLWLEL